MEKPYVISAEIDLPNIEANRTVKGNKISEFRDDLDKNLRALGKRTLWVPSSELRRGLSNMTSRSSLPVISLDDRYTIGADTYLGVSRGVDPSGDDAGYTARFGYQSLMAQWESMRPMTNEEVAVADDVIFTGEMLLWLRDELDKRGIKVKSVMAGIAIREGIERLEKEGISVTAISSFDDVEDEICERDFTITAGSGRRIVPTEVVSDSKNILYFDPRYGRPAQWASIPEESQENFWLNSLERNRRLLSLERPMNENGSFLGISQAGTIGDALRLRGAQS